MPAKAGTHDGPRLWLLWLLRAWVLAFARMTVAVAVAVATADR